jgi:Raf kinase inhibitor-like YbhB/YbcL family protein
VIRALGRRIRGWRAGAEHRTAEDDRFFAVPHTIELRSDAFAAGEPLPASRLSPPLRWSGVPPETRCLALVVEDVDVPLLRPFVHAIAHAIDPATTSFAAGALAEPGVTLGYNGAGRRAYVAPAPLPGHGVHHYVFTLLAIDYVPRFDQPPTKGRLLDAIGGHVVALGELVGTAER